jgi:hypothetical protein
VADLNDLFKSKASEPEPDDNRIDIDGMCEECYWPLSYGIYDSTNKKLKLVCINGHESNIDWEFYG